MCYFVKYAETQIYNYTIRSKTSVSAVIMMSTPVESAVSRQQLPVLYKLNNKNKVIQWEIEMFWPDAGVFYTYTSFGEVGGEIQTKISIIPCGKDGRSAEAQEAQMILEATSKWNKKKNRDAYSTSQEIAGGEKQL
jgi:hypothetical protein